MQRTRYDLTHQAHVCLNIGRVQTLTNIPIVAGDTIRLNIDGIIRLAPHRRELVQDAIIDKIAFFVPYRHVYPDQIPEAVLEGYDENVTLTGVAVQADSRYPSFLGWNVCGASIPTWTIQGYNRIWDRYFRLPFMPSLANSTDGLDSYPTDKATLLYGRYAARLPHPLTNGIDVGNETEGEWQDLQDADAEVSAAGSVVDVRDIARAQAILGTEIKRTWLSSGRYTDVLEQVWGTNVNIDADQRPELLWRETTTMSGTEVRGADDATLGQYVGRPIAPFSFNMPPRFFNEHGTLWVMAVIRFPLIHVNECHPLVKTVNPSMEDLLADPRLFASHAPVEFDPANWLSQFTVANAGGLVQPYGQHYRMHPNRVHKNFDTINGFPFLKDTAQTAADYLYHRDADYYPAFQTAQIGQAQIHSLVRVDAKRRIPPAGSSIHVGDH